VRRARFPGDMWDRESGLVAVAGTAAQVAGYMEEVFEAIGSRGGFMFAHPVATPRDLLNVVDFLVPELRRRGRFRDTYEGRTLRENLAT
jgi:long-chain alkane monooxygenase